MRLYLLDNPIQRYPWGSVSGLTDSLGIPNPDGGPLAEVWMGAHPKAPSVVMYHGDRRRLDELIAERPAAFLGKRAAERFGKGLPFLLKGISAAAPLSIQAHPSRHKAERGYERENIAGIPLDAPDRNYRDRNHKPEMVVALTPFEGLFGFRPIDEVIGNIALALPGKFPHQLERLERNPGRVELSVLFYSIMSSGGTERKELLSSAMSAISGILGNAGVEPSRRASFEWILRLGGLYPEDMGALAPLFMNHMTLEPGEALYVAPGELHGYFRGEALELMANSDNVLRGGLTSKHIDLPELISVLDFDSFRPQPFRAAVAANARAGAEEEFFPLVAPDFRLSRITPGGHRLARRGTGPEIILCTEGRAALSDGSGTLVLERGEAAFVRADSGGWSIEGNCVVHRAFLPPEGGPA
jgi:mannose-6-phosphate isomerase